MAHFKSNSRGGLSVDRDSLHASPEFKRQIEALSKLSGNPMTLPQNVKDAVALIETLANDEGDYAEPRAVETIRAHLMRQVAEIERRDAGWMESARQFSLQKRRAKSAESRLAAANALLREVSVTAGQSYNMTVVLQRIQSHLQGAGDEA